MNAYKKLLQDLFDENVRFLIVGGYAVIAHGLTRATDDLDVWIEPTIDNAQRTVRAIRRFDVTASDLDAERISDPYSFFRIGEDQGLKIDIMSDPGGSVEFYQAWSDRFVTEFLDLDVPFVGLRHLLLIKERVGRLQDLADVENLRTFHKGC